MKRLAWAAAVGGVVAVGGIRVAIAAGAQDACTWAVADSAWLAPALEAWQSAAPRLLRTAVPERPAMVLFNRSCVWTLGPAASDPTATLPLPGSLGRVMAHAAPHRGAIAAPDGVVRPPVPMAATLLAKDGRPFLLLSVLEVWERERPDVAADPEKVTWLSRVALHEMVHTLHLHHVAQLVEVLEARTKALPSQIDDDLVERTFRDNEAYRRAFLEERALLYDAALAEDDAEARRLAARALAIARARQRDHFTGAREAYLTLEHVFLTMEGLAEWFAFRAVPRTQTAQRDALEASRANLKNAWVQAEGLALFLLLERFGVPAWQSKALGADPPSPFDALEAGLARRKDQQ